MQTFTFHIDRLVGLPDLARIAASVFDVPIDRVRAIDYDEYAREPFEWFTDEVTVGLQVARLAGDFPLEITVICREEHDVPQMIGALANALSATLLTDEFGVNPLIVSAWTMVFPTGEVETVYADAEAFNADDPAIILLPAYRKDFDELHRRAVV